MPATLDSILGPEGAIARRLQDRYEHRPQQLEMARAVEEAFAQKHHLLVEAGTGVGKSFAYLVPAIRPHRRSPASRLWREIAEISSTNCFIRLPSIGAYRS